jgi:hypothetical protein
VAGEEFPLLIPVTVKHVIAPRSLVPNVAVYPFWFLQLVVLALLTCRQPGIGLWVHGLLLVATVGPGLRSARLVIGDDGLYLRWWNIERFISYREVASVTKDERGATVCLLDGEEVRLWAQFYGGHLREILTAQIGDRVARWQRWPVVEAPRLPAGVATYREPGWELERRVEAATNPRTPPELRMQAARALEGEVDSAVLERLGESAEATANPVVREAILGVRGVRE